MMVYNNAHAMTSLCGQNVADSVNVIQHTNANPTLIQLHVDVLVSHIFEFFPVSRFFLTLEEGHLEMTTHHGGRWFCWLHVSVVDIGQTTFGLLLFAQHWLHVYTQRRTINPF